MTTDWKDLLRQQSGFSDEEIARAAAESAAAESRAEAPRRADKLSIFIEKKGRGGKTATIITGFTCSDTELLDVAAKLKNRLGCGGSARGGEILIQGEKRAEATRVLRDLGYKLS